MKKLKRTVFVVCVDRDNDLGRKTKIRGPVIGKERVLEAAQKLILKDPTESDSNTMFAAIKKMDEAKKEFKNVEVAVLTGESKNGLRSDKEINKQLDILQKNHLIEGFILLTDGAEDSQVLPVLQSRAKIISTEQVIIKQAQAVESTFYTIKEALKDPGMARLFLGIPGIALLLFFALGQYSVQAIALIAGIYLMLKGFGIEDKLIDAFKVITTSVREQRVSIVMYVAALISPLFGIWLAYLQLISSEFIDISIDIISSLRLLYPFFALAIILLITGKAIDSIYEKKAYRLGKYLLQGVSVIAVWAIVDSGTLVFLRQAELAWFPASIMASLIALLVTMKISKIFDIRDRVTNALIGVNVTDEEGNYLGRVIDINKRKQSVIFNQDNKEIERKRKQFEIKNGKIVLLV
jgi:putative membrane protein